VRDKKSFISDENLLEVVLLSLLVSGTATMLAALVGLPLGIVIALRDFKGRWVLRNMFNALLGIPTVALGFILVILLARTGPFGFLDLLFTPAGIAIGEAILVAPLVVSFTVSALESVDSEIKNLARTLGASEGQTSLAVLSEAKKGITLAIIASFNRAIAELGVALMVGGNILGYTRVMTTAISRDVTMWNIPEAYELTAILLAIVFAMTFAINILRRD
jgi:tungstate transport system permease protein